MSAAGHKDGAGAAAAAADSSRKRAKPEPHSSPSQLESDAALAALFSPTRKPLTRGASSSPAPSSSAPAAAASSTPATAASLPLGSRAAAAPRPKRKHIAAQYPAAGDDEPEHEVDEEAMPPLEGAAAATPSFSSSSSAAAASSDASSSSSDAAAAAASSSAAAFPSPIKNASKEPANWRRVYAGIEEMRFRGIARDAPVDTMGCERLAKADASPKDQRFQTLVSLILSAQTKDAVTAQAMTNLSNHFASKGGLTVANALSASESQLDALISKVGFHQRKAGYIKRAAAVCAGKYNSDIPATVAELMALDGVGPKIAHLTMQVAWRSVQGIGVDTHVHRISGRLGWVNAAKAPTPEHTRKALEEWLPRELWGVINVLLVGFGQKVCLPIGPRCKDCLVNSLCPTGRSNLRHDRSPTKFHSPPPIKSVEQWKKEDNQAAQQVLHAAAAAGVKMEDEPMGVAAPTAASSSSSSSAAAAASALSPSLSSLFSVVRPPIKTESAASMTDDVGSSATRVKLEPASPASAAAPAAAVQSSSRPRGVKLEPALSDAAAAAPNASSSAQSSRSQAHFLQRKS